VTTCGQSQPSRNLRLGPNLTLGDVAKEAGVSPATLLQRFGSKRGLLLAFAAAGSVDVGSEFDAIRAQHESPIAALHALARCVAAMADTPETLSNSLAFLQMDLFDPDFHRHALAHSRGMRAGIKSLLDDAVHAGELPRTDTDTLSRAVQAMMGGSLLQWAIDREGKAADRLSEDLNALLNSGNSASRDRTRRPRRKIRRV
jgi:AcrR family transcriptional regulator